ncbi:valine--tRNA ligase [Candidatus Woesebacteria bacterium RIFCSPHIGHO2_12_FULL_42_9]|uniref:Valine--tRNA ligase n=1 Tax=Candidatus Woesebacteria bacterium RIFCSPHIGHO2_12_FULL_42_9 TaxID=1802511 RepID=A0A1F8ATY6_9BACT|nr:MAG: valine--tRNA ligase [Candidatus Woesebacteria bacterium RIFCSPHIGHO2_12_FULL_42_9]
MDKVYDHTKFEAETYRLWEKSGAFTARVDKKKKPFTIIMPPPNASDPLHIGHAREVATQDILTRYHRMKGESSLWLPGADHAGIETQFIFEKKLQKEGKSRFDFDRETLFKMIWDYVQENKSVMEAQLKTLGASCDWTRYKFTLDPDIVKIVYKTFKRLYADGLIYRGERIVNYCPRCGTAFSQLEVDSVERVDPLYYLDYGEVSIATTRPETIFADVAIAVNPDDVRYKHLIGKTATLPLIGRKLPIIADSLVDKDFGTGALKITPGHDATDFEIGQKHNLSALYVIDSVGRMVNTPAKYIGLKALDARNLVVEDLRAKGLIKKVQNIKHVVGVCYRDKGLIEPTISKQWFVKVSPLTKPALKAIREGQVSFAAKKYEKIAIHWLKNLKDWNISRQIVWGIRIPAWRCDRCLEWTITEGTPPEKCEACSHAGLTQDPDTFDTWFSSGQWPFATLQTTKHEDFEYFYPTSVMNPAYDILPFWVIRMVMLGLYVTGEPPFKEVLLHGLVRDKFGVKISKSKGNIINPIEMVQKYGADALRVALIWGSLVENDNSVSEENIKGQRNFANKIWNVSRFVLMSPQAKKAKRNEDDLEIIKHLKFTSKRVTKLLEKYRLNEAAEELYDFVWHKFADVYIEKTKGRREEAQKTLELVLQESLKLLHPFMPFVTEVIWQEGAKRFDSPTLISAPWPKS